MPAKVMIYEVLAHMRRLNLLREEPEGALAELEAVKSLDALFGSPLAKEAIANEQQTARLVLANATRQVTKVGDRPAKVVLGRYHAALLGLDPWSRETQYIKVNGKMLPVELIEYERACIVQRKQVEAVCK